MKLLAKELPVRYRPDLAEAAARFGSVLAKNGYWQDAREAFNVSKQLGRARYIGQRRMYRLLAQLWGPELTERLAFVYRGVIPAAARQHLMRWHF